MTRSTRRVVSTVLAGFLLLTASCIPQESEKERPLPVDFDKRAADLERPTLVGHWPQGPREAVAASGTQVYVGNGALLEVVDFSSPSRPSVQGRTSFPGPVLDVALTGTYAYIAHRSGLGIVDVSDPMRPERVTSDASGMAARQIVISESHAYVTTDSTLQILDVSDPAAPSPVGTLTTSMQALEVAVTEGHAYVLTGTYRPRAARELKVIDVGTPAEPQTVGSIGTPNYPEHLAAGKNHIYLDGENGVRTVDVTNPNTPRDVGFIEERTGQHVSHPTVVGDSLVYFTRSQGLEVANRSDPAHPQPRATVTAPVPHAVAVEGTYAYLALGANGLEAVNLSEPDHSEALGELEGHAATGAVATHSNYAYVEAGDGLRILDVSDSTRPEVVGFNTFRDGSIEEITVADSTAYLKYGQKFVILDLSDPSRPTEVARISGSHGIAVGGNFAYTAGDPMRMFDVSDPAAPEEVGAFDPGGRFYYKDVAVNGRHAVVLGPEMTVLDVSRPAEPQEVGSVPVGSAAENVVIQGRYAYVSGDKRLHVMDLSDPTRPQEVATVATGSTRRLVVAGPDAYLVSGNGEVVHRVDVSDPPRAQRTGVFDPGGQVWGIGVEDNRMYVGGGAAGLYVVTWDDEAPPGTS